MRRPFRVLHVIDSLDLGGAQVVLENLLTHADRSRFALEVGCMHGRGVFWERIKATQTPVPFALIPSLFSELRARGSWG